MHWVLYTILLLTTADDGHYDSYVFLKLYRTNARMYYCDGITLEVRHGYFNKYGDFIFEKIEKNEAKTKSENNLFWRDVANAPWCRNELLYEYRSGFLIPGAFGGSDQFIPSKDPIISLDDYLTLMNRHKVDLEKVYTRPSAFPGFRDNETQHFIIPPDGGKHSVIRRIYNLPGVFVRESKYEETKKKLFKLPFNVAEPPFDVKPPQKK